SEGRGRRGVRRGRRERRGARENRASPPRRPAGDVHPEGGGRTPWIDPKELKALGYSILLYPTTVIFRVTPAIQKPGDYLKAGRPMPADDSVTFEEYEDLLRLPEWADGKMSSWARTIRWECRTGLISRLMHVNCVSHRSPSLSLTAR